jgi:tetratricopeptide (TPR) repeat protein
VAWPTLLRLVVEDPSEEVCWTIASHFHTRITSRTGILPRGRDINSAVTPDIAELVRTQLNAPEDRPAATAISARAWEFKDSAKSLALYRKAIEMETRNPTQDNGELDEVFDILVANEIGATRFDEAAHLLRLQCGRISLSQVSADPDPVYALFVLHSRYGPLQGFGQDLQAYRDYTGAPEVLYALSRIFSRDGRWMEAMSFRQAAQSASLSAEEHYMLGTWLSQLSWNDLARHEFMATLSNEDPDTLIIQSMALARLALLASEEDNDAAAIDHLKKQVAISGEPAGIPVKAMLACFAARIANAKGDQAGLKAALDEAVEYRGNAYDITLKLYPILKSTGRDADAQRMFDAIYQLQSKALTEMGVDDAESFNNIAWLSSRCDQHLSEAASYAQRALAIDPDNAAYMDTLADVQFRLGKVEEAVQLESRALIYRPEDEFMHTQLERFKAARSK